MCTTCIRLGRAIAAGGSIDLLSHQRTLHTDISKLRTTNARHTHTTLDSGLPAEVVCHPTAKRLRKGEWAGSPRRLLWAHFIDNMRNR